MLLPATVKLLPGRALQLEPSWWLLSRFLLPLPAQASNQRPGQAVYTLVGGHSVPTETLGIARTSPDLTSSSMGCLFVCLFLSLRRTGSHEHANATLTFGVLAVLEVGR